MKYVNQNDYPDLPYRTHTEEPEIEYGRTSTVKTSGCGLASAVMVVSRLLPNVSFEIEDARELSYAVKATPNAGTKYPIFAPALAEKFNLRLEISDDPERLRYCLRTGGAAVVHCRNNRPDYTAVFTKGGHYVAAVSEEPDGRIVVLDPNLFPGKFDTPERAGKVELQRGVLCLVEMQVLVEDSLTLKPNCFYLFWRA